MALATQVRAGGGDPGHLGLLDGLDQWPTLTGGGESARVEMLYNIDPLQDEQNGPGGAVRCLTPSNSCIWILGWDPSN